jgi:hypothetical protein
MDPFNLFCLGEGSYRRMMYARKMRPKDVANWTGLSYQKVTALAAMSSPPPQYWPCLAWALGIDRRRFAHEMHACLLDPISTLEYALDRMEKEEIGKKEIGAGI